ncbi:MAG: hypothetical protein H6538_04275 [Bacteroidales bacterium]|nr:hypothetical protein [Bacteroidales bacterium]
MKALSNSQIDTVIQWVRSQRLSIKELENEFVDHICCDLEALMEEGESFTAAFTSLTEELGDTSLPELEKQTILLLTYNQRLMRKLTRFSGIFALSLFFLAVVLRLITSGIWESVMASGMVVLGLFFVPLYFMEHYSHQEVKSQKVLHLLGFLAAFLIPLSAIMVLINSPYAIVVLGIGVVFLVFGFAPLSWMSVSKGSARFAITGGIMFLMFFVLLSYGFLGLKITRDRVDNWVWFSVSSDKTGSSMEMLTAGNLERFNNDADLKQLASEIASRTEIIISDLTKLRDGFIKQQDKNYKRGDLFFKGMDSNFAGQMFLIDNEQASEVLKSISAYESWLITLLSEENEQTKSKISELLKIGDESENANLLAQKNYLFRDFPSIADVSVINSLILNIRIAELQTLSYLEINNKTKLN